MSLTPDHMTRWLGSFITSRSFQVIPYEGLMIMSRERPNMCAFRLSVWRSSQGHISIAVRAVRVSMLRTMRRERERDWLLLRSYRRLPCTVAVFKERNHVTVSKFPGGCGAVRTSNIDGHMIPCVSFFEKTRQAPGERGGLCTPLRAIDLARGWCSNQEH